MKYLFGKILNLMWPFVTLIFIVVNIIICVDFDTAVWSACIYLTFKRQFLQQIACLNFLMDSQDFV